MLEHSDVRRRGGQPKVGCIGCINTTSPCSLIHCQSIPKDLKLWSIGMTPNTYPFVIGMLGFPQCYRGCNKLLIIYWRLQAVHGVATMGNGTLTFCWYTCGISHWLEIALSLFNPWCCSTLWGSAITHTPCPLCMFKVHTIMGLCQKWYFGSLIIYQISTLSLWLFGNSGSWTCGGRILIEQHFQWLMYSFSSLYHWWFWFIHITATRSPCEVKNHIGHVENYHRWSLGDHQ